MHERYAYFSDVFTVLTAFTIPNLWPAALLMVGASFCSYIPFIYRLGDQFDKLFPFFALLAFGTLVLLYQELERRQVIDLGGNYKIGKEVSERSAPANLVRPHTFGNNVCLRCHPHWSDTVELA